MSGFFKPFFFLHSKFPKAAFKAFLCFIALCGTTCGVSHDVTSNSPIQKRKYQNGWHLSLDKNKKEAGLDEKDKLYDSLEAAPIKVLETGTAPSLSEVPENSIVPEKNEGGAVRYDGNFEKDAKSGKDRIFPGDSKRSQVRIPIVSTKKGLQKNRTRSIPSLDLNTPMDDKGEEEEPDIIGIIGFSVSCLGLVVFGLLFLVNAPFLIFVYPPILISGFIISLFGDSWFATLGWVISGVPLALSLSFALGYLIFFLLLS